MSNALFTILVDCRNGIWAFDDPARDLYREALVAGIPEMIEHVAPLKGIRHPRSGVNFVFSAVAFPGHDFVLERVPGGSKEAGNYYSLAGTQMQGWLCPALYKYFDQAPDKIYVAVKPVS